MRTTLRHGGKLDCDFARCTQFFVTYSMVSLARAQAKAAGWGRVFAWQITKDDLPDRLLDVCPKHAKVAEAAKSEREAMLAAEREERKAERAELRAAKLDVKKAERAQAKAARDAERAAAKSAKLAQRDVERARKKAAKIEAKVRGAQIHVATVPMEGVT